MLLSKKPLSALLAAVFLCQQAAFAATPLDMARALDARRFAVVKSDSEEPVKLENAALEKLEKFNKKTGSTWRIRMNGATKNPRSLVGGRSVRVGSGDKNALKFIKSNKDLLGVNEKDLKLLRKPLKSAVGMHFYFKQYYKDLPVENAYVKVNVDKSGALLNYQSTYVPDLNIDVKESVSAASAASIAAQDAGGKALNTPEKVIYVTPGTTQAKLAWKTLVQGGENAPAKWDYYVDAQTGDVLNRISKIFYASKKAAFSININPVYPNAPGISTQTLPLSNMYVYSFDGSGNAQAPKTTSAVGEVTTSGRMWATLSGPYFTVTNEAALTKYYVEKGDGETFGLDWTEFAKGAAWQTYNACENSGYYPVFSYPLIKNLNIGKMNISGDIEDKKFLLLGSSLPENRTLGAYIGRFNSLNGPLISNYNSAQMMNISAYPADYTPGESDYSITSFNKLCVPSSAPARYSSTSTATLPVVMVNDNIQTPEAVAFYNLNAMRDYFVSLAGNDFDLNGHMPVMVNASGSRYSSHDDGMQNAFYDLDADLILVGQGHYDVSKGQYVNFALESAIVRHEYVHAVMNKIWPIIYFDEGAAISEAVSDYFALSSLKDASGNPYTSIIGGYVAGASGEGMARNLDGTDSYTPEKWLANGAPMGQHANSKFLSQALWQLRISSIGANVDKLVWNALMFFPDSLLEFRDAMIAVAGTSAIGGNSAWVTAVENAFDVHGITYDNIITAQGDIYEPNNGPTAAADIDVASISRKELSASINPASDMDYYSISLPEGQFKAVLTMPKVREGRYIPLGMLLLDADMQTAVDLVRPSDVPDDQQGNTGITTNLETITLTFNAPSLLNGNTGRYILGVYKLSNGYYPSDISADTGAYKLNFTFAQGTNVGNVEVQLDDFNDGRQINFSVPLATTKDNGLNATLNTLGLGEWAPSYYEFFHSARLLDSDMNPIPGANTADANYLDIPRSIGISNNIMSGKVTLQNGFSSLGYNMVYLQVFGKLRSNKANETVGNTEYRDDYGVVSLGISNPIVTASTTGEEVHIRDSVFNPMKGGKVKLEIVPKSSGKLKAQIFTVDGLLVKTLKDADVQEGITQIVEWDGRNGAGKIVASSVYLLRVDGAGIDRKLKKIVVVK